MLPVLLSPLSALVAAFTANRMARKGWLAPVPVICCGNVTVGGAGKTTLALDIAARLTARGIAVHVLLRGYGGSSLGVRRVELTFTQAYLIGAPEKCLVDLVWKRRDLATLKALEEFCPAHEAQLLNYLKASDIEIGLLLNFGPKPRIKRLAFSNDRKRSRPPIINAE